MFAGMVPLSFTGTLEFVAVLEATAAASDKGAMVDGAVRVVLASVGCTTALPGSTGRVKEPALGAVEGVEAVKAGVAIGTVSAGMPSGVPVAVARTAVSPGGAPVRTARAVVAVGPRVVAVFSKHKHALDTLSAFQWFSHLGFRLDARNSGQNWLE